MVGVSVTAVRTYLKLLRQALEMTIPFIPLPDVAFVHVQLYMTGSGPVLMSVRHLVVGLVL